MRKDVMLQAVLLSSVTLTAGAASASSAASAAPHVYQLDMFSLISFGLAITALLLAFFMAWLSWEFYKKSTEASDKTNETVTKVETLVAGVQSNISDIVNRAVNYWIETGGGDGQINQSKLEVYEKLAELEQAIQKGGNGNPDGLLQEVAALKAQLDELGRGIRESQIKALFPTIVDDSPTVKYEQEVVRAEQKEQSGIVRISVLRPTKIATATVRFNPIFSAPPELAATLISSPYDDVSSITAKAGTPGTRVGNIHLNSTTSLKPGIYVFEYIAKEC